jgi:membrane protease YdiL (CAAX protease family)
LCTIIYYTLAGKNCQKEQLINGLTEALILYLVLFFPQIRLSSPDTAAFSVFRELGRLFYTVPSTILILHLLSLSGDGPGKPRRRDLKTAAFVLPLLAAAGCVISLASRRFAGVPVPPEAPALPLHWPFLIAACFGTGYFEEAYFRLYLLRRLGKSGLGAGKSVAVATALFCLCHVYEGPWGTLNAAAAGIILSLFFIREGSLHGIAWAHGLYNILVYLMAAKTA